MRLRLGNQLTAPFDADRRRAVSWLLLPWEPACIVPAIGETASQLLPRVPPWEPARVVPAVRNALRLGNLLAAPFDADRQRGCVVIAAPALGASPFDTGHVHSAQIVGEVMSLLFPPWELHAHVVPLCAMLLCLGVATDR
ncbi:hypothetical protein BC826DRAFT_1112812 [Russula brevipes]|nr:hypothetical protein BC826DRAFT_1112812 [Russula brevipes]